MPRPTSSDKTVYMTRAFSRTLAALLILVTWGLAPDSHASARGAAQALFQAGRDAMGKGDFETACARFLESYRLDPAGGTIMNLGNCQTKKGELASALESFQTAKEQLKSDDWRRATVIKYISDLKTRVPKLVIEKDADAPAGMKAKRGELDIGEGMFGAAIPVNPGALEIIVTAPGYQGLKYSVTIVEGETKRVQVNPGEKLQAGAPAAASAPARVKKPAATQKPSDKASPAASEGGNSAGWPVLAFGSVFVVAGAITGVFARSAETEHHDECNDQTRTCTTAGQDAAESATRLSIMSNVGWILGGVGVGLGTYLLITDESEETALGAQFTTTGAGLQLRRRF